MSSPFSYSCKKTPKDAEDQIEAGLGAARAMQLTHGTVIVVGGWYLICLIIDYFVD